ncbi:hypothetical protein EV385_1676 [Krasilnikovia cinnamomea]|uniref:Uncharacterized protein n=1 Tax=Krasilnikovia cinnamomea TaxID=349313 RepID=A0A4Q7ZII2_9ACTN|nr:hypothetical protein [Krasilnikovia cinnamomea]RZU49919.1 hypothetical protein EV385_1676 [Krasilnikovia cinnamomea]
MTPRERDYQLMMSALAEAARRRDTELDGAEQAYQDSAAQAAGELARAEGEAAAADRWAGAAAAQVLDVDREAARLWDQLRRARGMRVRALGELPEPAAVEALPRVALQRAPEPGGDAAAQPPRQSARTLLARAAERIDDTVRPAVRDPLPRWALALLPVAGALVAGATGLLAAGLVTFGGTAVPGGVVVRALGWLAFLLAPSAGVPVAAAYAHRHGHRLEIGGIGLTLLGGMVAAALLSLTFASAN